MTLLGAIKSIFNYLLAREKIYCIIGEVTVVDNGKRTCTVKPIDGTPDLYDVRMTPEISTTGGLLDGLCVFPNKGSMVVVAFLNPTTGVIISSNTASQIFSDTKLFQFNQGKNFGLIKIVELTTKLNQLKTEFNNFVLVYNSHVHTGVTAGGASTAVTPSQAVNATPFNKSDYEDTLITH